MFNVTASHSPKHFLLEDPVFIRTFPWWQQGYFDRSWNLSTNLSQSSIPCSTYLQQRRGGIISNLTKVNLFSYNNQVLFGVISQCSRHPAPSQRKLSSLVHFDQKNNRPGHSIKRRAYWFVWKTARAFPIPTGREESEWWTLC